MAASDTWDGMEVERKIYGMHGRSGAAVSLSEKNLIRGRKFVSFSKLFEAKGSYSSRK